MKNLVQNPAGTASSPLPVSSAAYGLSGDSVTRPANTTAYTVGDVISTTGGEVLEFAAIGPSGGLVLLQTASLMINVGTVPAGIGAIRLHLYGAAPAAIADNAAFNLAAADRDKYLGYFDFSAPIDLGDTLWAQVDYVGQLLKLTTASLFGIVETRNAFTPSSESTYTIKLNAFEAGR